MDERAPEIMLQFCKAMADESRLKMVGMLSAAEHSVQQLAAMLNLKEPTVSHHLAVLKQLELVKMRADGNFRWYRLNEEVLGKISRSVFSRGNLARLAADLSAARPRTESARQLSRRRTFARDPRQLQEAISNTEVARRFLRAGH